MSQRVSKKKIGSIKGLPLITCSCGAKILLVPDVKIMSKAIEAHVAKHAEKVKDPKGAKVEAERLRDELITQVFEKASQAQDLKK